MEPLKLIKTALDSSISCITNGASPTSALEKVARDYSLNPNYIQRVGEALNVALHYNHFSKQASAKAEDFPVADIPAVTKNIFGGKEQTLAQKKASWFPTAVAEINYAKFLTDASFHKTAAAIEKNIENYDSFDTSVPGQYKKAADSIARLEKELDEVHTEKVGNDAYLEAVFNANVNYFKKSAAARISFASLEKQALTEFGDQAKDYLDLIYKAANLNEPRGSADSSGMNFEAGKELSLFSSLIKSASAAAELKTKLADKELFVGLHKAMLKKAASKMHPTFQWQEKTAAEQLAATIDLMLEKEAFGAGIKESLVMDLYNQLADAAYDRDKPSVPFKNTKMDNLNKITMVQELIMTDPILKHQPPQKVLQAYQTMLRMSPHLAADKEVTRALLRQLTATQSIAPTEANQWIEANTNLMKQQQLMHSSMSNKREKK